MIKIYETIEAARLVTTIEVGTENKTIVFVGGAVYPMWRSGIFTTGEVSIQEAIEKSSSFGVSYRLKESVNSMKKSDDKVVLKNIEEVRNKQSAIEWMRINMFQSYTIATSADLIRDMAYQEGYLFINWIKK